MPGGVDVVGRNGNYDIFRCAYEETMHRVVAQGPYAVQGAFLIVDYWQTNLILDRMRVVRFAVWVRLHGLPLECLSMEAGFQLGQAIREVLQMDYDEGTPQNIRFLRRIPTDHPLISGFFFNVKMAMIDG
ncbi:hypothetical protein LOK49_LG07G03196 [Camellia lanceoleosa]|uniref:Uncharacterized protein n=1 Tax=Camellia lanceoleosa TaxID=1840588 RepID=A0ACC0H5K5_9ERIC|nr:hypothetical protein LOK49_LG07G03196 [Camellia lanceoleosa]